MKTTKFPLVRPATLADLPHIISFAADSGYGITSLPQNSALLEKKVNASQLSFHKSLSEPHHETYLFCLEWEDKVIGTSGIISRIGTSSPFFAYHLRFETHKSAHLGIDRKVPVLHFTTARKKPTEVGTLYLAKHYRRKEFGKLLSFTRFLFMAQFRKRFASTVIAELRGINMNGKSPFWEAVGRHFFQTDFPTADFLRTEHPSIMEELSPKYPIYVDLLPQEAREAIGVVHEDTLPARRLLEKQGFKMSHYVDVFDAGPHLYAPTSDINVIKESREIALQRFDAAVQTGSLAIISNTRLDFRATLAPLLLEGGRAILHPDVADILKVKPGDLLRYYLL